MGLIRLIILAAVVWLLVRTARRVHRQIRDQRQRTDKRVDRGNAATPMAKCAHCGTYVPSPQAVNRDGAQFCSDEHAAAGPAER